MSDPASATLIRHKLPMPIKIVVGFALAVLPLALHATLFETHQYDVALLALSVLGGGAALIFTNHRGYRIAWDDAQIYMRDWGWRNLLFQRHPWRVLAYSDMGEMWGISPAKPAPGVTRVMPYQVLEISSATVRKDGVSLYGSGLNDDDLLFLLCHLRDKRPDIFPEPLSDHLRALGALS